MDDLEQVKKAVEIEVKYKYINITGKSRNFASFICSVLRKEIKQNPKNPKWKILLEHFERYPVESAPSRKKSLDRLVSVIRAEYLTPKEEKKENSENQKSLSQADVTYIKGVGPKIAYLMNKLGIFTANDLLYYFPRKHVDYSTRTKIKDLSVGMNTTIFGRIKSTEAFTTKSKLGVVKVKIADGTGNINLNFFSAKAGKFVQERMKSQFPKGAGIMVSGTVKFNSYDGMLTLDKPTYSIMDEDIISPVNVNMARIVPIYTVNENLNIKTLRKAICLRMFTPTMTLATMVKPPAVIRKSA